MGQYFKLVCPSRNEYVNLPGLMKAIERMTNPTAMGMIGYLLLEGPLDGTAFPYQFDKEDPIAQEAIEKFIERETELEEKNYERYLTGERDYVKLMFENEYGYTPDEDDETFQEMCRERSRSTYRKENLNWDREQMKAAALAGFEINEVFDYAGRWAGEDVRLVGDYAENDLYSDTNEDWIYEYSRKHTARDPKKSVDLTQYTNGEQFTAYATSSAPIVPESIARADICHSTERRDVEKGDICEVKHPETNERVYAHFVEVAEMEWTNITDGLTDEFANFVGEDWLENNDSGLLRPDMVISA